MGLVMHLKLFKTFSKEIGNWLKHGGGKKDKTGRNEIKLINCTSSLEVECNVAIVATRVQFPAGALFIFPANLKKILILFFFF